MLFQIVDNINQWNQILKKFTKADVYYTFEYGSQNAQKEQGVLLAAFYEKGNSRIYYPFIKRLVDWKEETLYDIVTPYGYGGPLIEGDSGILHDFYIHFECFCKENKIIAETIRFHPFLRNYKSCAQVLDVQYIRKTTAVDLNRPLEQIRKEYSSMNKRNIKKAKGEGLSCYTAEISEKNVYTFIELYKETMDRNHADSYYYFDDKYFFDLFTETDLSKTHLLFVQYKNEIIGALIVLVGSSYAHYHLGASKTKYLNLKPNNLLFDFMIEFCKNQHTQLLHLGGGYQEDDGLFKFKSSFTNNNYFDYFIGKRIYDSTKYKKITEELKKYYELNENYFPIYRGKKNILNESLS